MTITSQADEACLPEGSEATEAKLVGNVTYKFSVDFPSPGMTVEDVEDRLLLEERKDEESVDANQVLSSLGL